ncbi:MAG: CRISPR-associated protein Cas4 [Hyphomicrobiales bacterium]|nr:CRISPR-associated protein Cas4 [Hyphomicrobiales bacterium]
MDEIENPIPLSAVQHAVYCLRQAALIHLERLWQENVFTAEGRILHDAVHEPGARRCKDVRRVHAMALSCRRLGVAGIADLVEFRAADGGETAFPVEFKRGKPKLHRADEAQLCAQALCLEEMTGRPVPRGALFYAKTKRRQPVNFDEELRNLTEGVIARLHDIFSTGKTPAASFRAQTCRACSLIELCQPKACARSAAEWRNRQLAALLADEGNNDRP